MKTKFDNKIKIIKQLTSETEENFNKLYLSSVRLFSNYCLDDKKILHALDRIIVALKLRRGCMLPPNSDAETCYREQDVWTLAVFLVALLHDLRSTLLEMSLGTKLIPQECIDFLYEFKNSVFTAFTKCFRNSEDNPIIKIVDRAENIVNKQLGKKGRQASSDLKSIEVKSINICDEFISWLKLTISEQKFSVNDQNSIVHRVSEGLFLIMPEILDVFLAANRPAKKFLVAANSQNCATYFLNQIPKKGLFVRHQNGSFVHEYYNGNWDATSYISGLLIKYKQLDLKRKLLINNNLKVRPKL